MYGLYTPVIVFQAICIYHAYRNNVEHRWYWIIGLFPVIGCAIYLVHHFNTRDNLKNITEVVKGVVNSNYNIEKIKQ